MPHRPSDRGVLAPSAVLGLLGTRGPIARADIARALNLSPATVTQVTKGLLARGLVLELENAPSQGGRPGRLLGLTSQRIGALGAKVTSDHVAVVQVSIDGAVRRGWTLPFDARRSDAIDQLAVLLRGCVAECEPSELLGLGVAVPGSVDRQGSGVVDAPTLGWRAQQVGKVLREYTRLPVLIENDVNAVTVSERLYGRGREHESFLTVTIGRGVGAGIIVDGELYRGAAGGAGEIGHLPVDPAGPRCSCGNRGCLEALVGEAALVTAAAERGVPGAGAGLAGLRAAAHAGDAAARRVFADAGAVLGRALAGVVHTVDPEIVLILGEGVEDWPLWEAGFQGSFRGHLLPARGAIQVIPERWSDDRWAQGAAALVLTTPFDSAGATGEQGRRVRERLARPTASGAER